MHTTATMTDQVAVEAIVLHRLRYHMVEIDHLAHPHLSMVWITATLFPPANALVNHIRHGHRTLKYLF